MIIKAITVGQPRRCSQNNVGVQTMDMNTANNNGETMPLALLSPAINTTMAAPTTIILVAGEKLFENSIPIYCLHCLLYLLVCASLLLCVSLCVSLYVLPRRESNYPTSDSSTAGVSTGCVLVALSVSGSLIITRNPGALSCKRIVPRCKATTADTRLKPSPLPGLPRL